MKFKDFIGVIILFDLCDIFTNFPLYLMYLMLFFHISMQVSGFKEEYF
jgi:hypothetical protein